MNWRNGKGRGPRDPPFRPPVDAEGGIGAYDELEEEEEEHQYGHVPNLRDNSNSNASPFSDSNAANRVSTSSSYVLPPVSGVGGFSSGANIPASRPSMDAYGAFSDPAPSGYGQPQSFNDASGLGNPNSPAGVSRTMQYADPYAAVRASIAGSPASQPQHPPGYSEYSGYR